MPAKKKAEPKGKSNDQATVEAYLIEHGGAPSMTFILDSAPSATLTAPQFPDPMPTLAKAMADFPCEDKHKDERGEDRYPAVCCVTKRLKKGARITDEGVEGPDCGREIPLKLLGRKDPHVGCPICRPYPEGYDVVAEQRKDGERIRLEVEAGAGPRRQRRAAQRTLKKVAKKRQN